MLVVTHEIKIPLHELSFSYARSSGPGGQNVNKVNSKVLMRWNPFESSSISVSVRARFLARYGKRLNAEGSLIIMSDRFRDQLKNRSDCLDKLKALLLEVAYPPRMRRKTRPTRSSIEKNKQQKRHHGEKKRQRSRVARSDD